MKQPVKPGPGLKRVLHVAYTLPAQLVRLWHVVGLYRHTACTDVAKLPAGGFCPCFAGTLALHHAYASAQRTDRAVCWPPAMAVFRLTEVRHVLLQMLVLRCVRGAGRLGVLGVGAPGVYVRPSPLLAVFPRWASRGVRWQEQTDPYHVFQGPLRCSSSHLFAIDRGLGLYPRRFPQRISLSNVLRTTVDY